MHSYRQSELLHFKLRLLTGLGENVELWYHNGSCMWPKCIHRGDSPPTLLSKTPHLEHKVFELQEFEAFLYNKTKLFCLESKGLCRNSEVMVSQASF